MWLNFYYHFQDSPVFGTGILTSNEYVGIYTSYHNLVIDAVTNTGLVGLTGTLVFIYIIIKQTYHIKVNRIIGISMVTMFIASMLDTVHVNPITLILIFVTLSLLVEQENPAI